MHQTRDMLEPPMYSSFLSKPEDCVCVLWGCELTASNRRFAFEVPEDYREHQLSLRTICLGAEAGDELNVVAVESMYTHNAKPVIIASLRSSVLPMVSIYGIDLLPPATFMLISGSGPVYISGQHLILEEEMEEEYIPINELSIDDLQYSPY
ncbi:nucleoplasmin-like isoform X2 [Protopterus annectens]|nr:nucleoplasmin-like isoform X2 [Protopterus annectens]XP_043938419.1 nucleoplasmin-like isoform X2 [Protopterus annectens]